MPSPVRIGLLGLGTVGSGVVEILERHRGLIAARCGVELEVVRACVKNRRRKRPGPAGAVSLTTKPADVIEADDVDVVAELIGGKDPARQWILDALAAGKPVVTANKAVLAAHGPEIFAAAARARRDVYFEAAVAGGIPIIRTLREGLASDRITELVGILNGTTNFILDRLGQGDSYAAALADAQRLGFAEADPTLDVEGNDAADKLAILTQLAYGTVISPEAIPTIGVTALTPQVLSDASELGYRVKLLAIARRAADSKGREGLDIRVHPAFVPRDHVLAAVPAAQNAIAIQSDALGASLYQGAGAGGLPTGSAVVSDLIEVARNVAGGISGRIAVGTSRSAPKVLPQRESVSGYYVRLAVVEQPGVLAAVTRIFARFGISLKSVRQDQHAGSEAVPIVITTHDTSSGAMTKALRAVAELSALQQPPVLVRIAGA